MSKLLGQKLKEIRQMTLEELEHEGWNNSGAPPTVLVFNNGIKLYPSIDPEGNGPGILFGIDKNKEVFIL